MSFNASRTQSPARSSKGDNDFSYVTAKLSKAGDGDDESKRG